MALPNVKKFLKQISKWKFWERQLLDPSSSSFIMFLLILCELFGNIFVIWTVKYTEIDWIAYMQEVEGVLNGTFDYSKLKGDTGPLVYPAGFVYIFSILYYITNNGVNIRLAQYIFMVLYLCNLVLIFNIYRKTRQVPPFVFLFMCFTSYRIHSIFILRLFNDPIAVLLFFISVNFMINDSWMFACFFYSWAVSVKMNILLFAPGLFYLLIRRHRLFKTFFRYLPICAMVQLVLAWPFLMENTRAYLVMSFDLSRQFFFKWTVNWRFLGEEIFLNRNFHIILLVIHFFLLMTFGYFKWIRGNGLTFTEIIKGHCQKKLTANEIVEPLFVSNFIGICFSRSLHYQFYVWYFYTLHYLLWISQLSNVFRLLLLGLIEMAWNTYPSTIFSSLTLNVCHIIMLTCLWLKKSDVKSKES